MAIEIEFTKTIKSSNHFLFYYENYSFSCIIQNIKHYFPWMFHGFIISHIKTQLHHRIIGENVSFRNGEQCQTTWDPTLTQVHCKFNRIEFHKTANTKAPTVKIAGHPYFALITRGAQLASDSLCHHQTTPHVAIDIWLDEMQIVAMQLGNWSFDLWFVVADDVEVEWDLPSLACCLLWVLGKTEEELCYLIFDIMITLEITRSEVLCDKFANIWFLYFLVLETNTATISILK